MNTDTDTETVTFTVTVTDTHTHTRVHVCGLIVNSIRGLFSKKLKREQGRSRKTKEAGSRGSTETCGTKRRNPTPNPTGKHKSSPSRVERLDGN